MISLINYQKITLSLDDDDEDKFIVKEGADALEAMLADLDLDEMAL